MIKIKSDSNLELMRKSGKICADTLSYLSSLCQPGVTGVELDKKAEEFIRDHNAIPATIGYRGYKHSICLGINNFVVHCPPTNLPIKDGDLVKFDLVVSFQGWCSDSALTLLVPPIRPEVEKFVETTKAALWRGIEKAVEGNYVGDISQAIFDEADKNGYGVVIPFVGHGIGFNVIHEAPQIPNIPQKTKGSMLVQNETICIEPIFTMFKDAGVYFKDNEWATFTLNGGLAAHAEHTILITKDKAEVLTLKKGEKYGG
jgi:methionyl aminopeptidase